MHYFKESAGAFFAIVTLILLNVFDREVPTTMAYFCLRPKKVVIMKNVLNLLRLVFFTHKIPYV